MHKKKYKKEFQHFFQARQYTKLKMLRLLSGCPGGKSRVAVELNRAINFINLSIHAHYKDILKRTGKVTAIEVKNAFQGIATAQKTLLVLFGEMMEDFNGRIGTDRVDFTAYSATQKRIGKVSLKWHQRYLANSHCLTKGAWIR